LVAKYASEWNAVYLPANEIKDRNQRLDNLLQENGRRPKDVRRSLMTGTVFGKDSATVKQKVKERTQGKLTPKELAARGLAVGTANQIADQLGAFAEAGIQRVMLQWLGLDDLDGLEALAKGLLHQAS
jgi:alkanesulfonate monooxygenase SsuD/methylene tetrahydromethanopterin reductase-like flavin-dependent oxidoreductase (luciferase family)